MTEGAQPPQRRVAAGRAALNGRTLIIGGLAVVLLLLAWRLADVLMLLFAAIVVASILRSFADLVTRYARVPIRLSVLLVAVLLVTIVAVSTMLFGASIRADMINLAHTLPTTIRTLGVEIGVPDLYERITEPISLFLRGDPLLGHVASYTSNLISAATTAILVLMGSIYLAMDPMLYRRGLLRLIPKSRRPLASATLADAAQALRHWLMGQIVTAVYIAAVTSLVLWLIGVPHWMALGMISGAFEFIPYVGGLAAAVPALLIALSTGNPMMLLWVAGAYLVIQQFEGNVLSPLIQQWAVHLPPVVGLFSLIAMGVLFGPLGVLLATPFTVVVVVFVKRLYVGGLLRDPAVLEPATPARIAIEAPAAR